MVDAPGWTLGFASAGVLDSPFGMRWSTFAVVVVMLALIGVAGRRPVVAVVAVLAWAGGFEVTFRLLEILRWREWWGFHDLAWEAAALGGWPVAAHVVGIRPGRAWVVVTVATLAVWFALGLDYNLPQTGPTARQAIRVVPEALNVTAKTAWAMAYLAGALRLPTPRAYDTTSSSSSPTSRSWPAVLRPRFRAKKPATRSTYSGRSSK